MLNNLIFLRHYIFIDPDDILNDINNNDTLKFIKKKHKEKYINGEIVKYYGYQDIVNLLDNYDKELCKLFKEINCNYPALLADIGRLIILYKYGGVYHDLRFMSKKILIDYLSQVSFETELIAEEHPKETDRVRVGNIITLHKHSKFIALVLEKIKKKLKSDKNAFGSNKVNEIGSDIYINEFKKNKNPNIYKYPFFNTGKIKKNNKIYMKRARIWQETNEPIFKKNDL